MGPRQFHESKGLAAIEVAILIAVLIVVLAMVIPSMRKQRDKANRRNVLPAIRQGDADTVRSALESRTNANDSLSEEWTAPDGTTTTMQYSLLAYAVKWNHPKVVKALIDHGADPDGKGWRNARQPIFWAAVNANEEIFTMLIEAGADIDARIKGKTALEHANGTHEQAAAFLRAHGAK